MNTKGYLLLPVFLLIAACAGVPGTSRPAAPPPTVTLPGAPPAVNTTPTAAAPGTAMPAVPSPTSDLLSTPAGERVVVLIDSAGQIQLYSMNRRAVVPITREGGAVDLALSPEGDAVLYRREEGRGVYELWLAPVDGSGERPLVTADRLQVLDPEAFGVSVWRYEWLPDASGFIFNTQEVFEDSPGLRLYEDLHRFIFDADGFDTLLAAGTGGGKFAVSPDGLQVAFSRANSVNLVGVDGEGLVSDLVAFPQILTYSEYLYYPEMVWEPDSTSFWVVVPPSDPLQIPVLPTMVYRVSAPGSTERVAILPDAAFFGEEVRLSADFTMAVYTRMQGSLDGDLRELVIARFDGSEPQILSSASGGSYETAWAPAAPELLIAGPDEGLYRARVVSADVRMEEIGRAQGYEGLRWLGETGYLVWALEDGGWSLLYGELEGTVVRIAEGQTVPGSLDAGIFY